MRAQPAEPTPAAVAAASDATGLSAAVEHMKSAMQSAVGGATADKGAAAEPGMAEKVAQAKEIATAAVADAKGAADKISSLFGRK